MESPFLQRLTKQWHTLRSSRAGERFRKTYEIRCSDRGLLWRGIRNRFVALAAGLTSAGALAYPWSVETAFLLVGIALVVAMRESEAAAAWLDAADRRRHVWMKRRHAQQLRRGKLAPTLQQRRAFASAAFGAGITALAIALLG